MIGLLHSWIHSSCDSPHKTYTRSKQSTCYLEWGGSLAMSPSWGASNGWWHLGELKESVFFKDMPPHELTLHSEWSPTCEYMGSTNWPQWGVKGKKRWSWVGLKSEDLGGDRERSGAWIRYKHILEISRRTKDYIFVCFYF